MVNNKRKTAIRIYKRIIWLTWPFVMLSACISLHIVTSIFAVCTSGYDYGDHPVGGWNLSGVTLSVIGIGIAASLIVACLGILVIATFLSLFGNLNIRSVFKKAYKGALLATWPIIFITFLVLFIGWLSLY